MNKTLFDQTFNSVVASGVDKTEIYKRLNETLDAIAAEEKQKVDKEKAEREKVIHRYSNVFAKNDIDSKTVAAGAVLAYVDKHPEWTVDDINEFAETIEDTVKLAAQTVGKSSTEITKMLTRDFSSQMREMMKKHGINGWKPLKGSLFDWDDEAIDKFLKDLDFK